MRYKSWMLTAAVLSLAGCGGATGPYGSGGGGGGGSATTINVNNDFFNPTPNTVAAGVVTFRWVTPSHGHTLTWDSGPGTLPANTGTITALTVTIVVQRTAGISHQGMYDNVGGFTSTNNSSANLPAITYTWTRTGGSLSAGSGRLFVAQTNGNQPHSSSGDTWTVTYTTGGQTFTQNGTY